MKKSALIMSVLMICAVMLGAFALPAYAAGTAVEIDELNMSISVPNDMLTVTRDSKKTDSYFSKFGLDYDETMADFDEKDIYLQSMKEDSSLTLLVTMTENSDSREVENYSKLSDEELAQINEEFRADKNCKSVTRTKLNGITYYVLEMRTKSGKKTVQAQQYNTVINGENIVVSIQASVGKKLTEADRETLSAIMSDTTILEHNFFNDNRRWLLFGGIILGGVIIAAIVLIILLRRHFDRDRRNKNLVHDLAHEHNISETTQIPKKDIFNLKQPTMSFMTNYQPLEEIDEAERKSSAKLATEDDAEGSTHRFESNAERADEAAAVSEPSPFEDEISDIVASRNIPESLGDEEISENAVELYTPERDEDVEPEFTAEEESEVIARAERELGEQTFDEPNDYFDDAPDEDGTYSAENVGEAMREYGDAGIFEEEFTEEAPKKPAPKDRSKQKAQFKSFASKAGEIALKILGGIGTVFIFIGKGLWKLLQWLWMIICFVVIHCKYFCINVYREIKRSRAKKKRVRAQEERRRVVSEQRRAQREAERQRQQRNARRGENDLVQVRSSSERRPTNRPKR